MKVTFFSNFLNHHQLPFCLEMQKKLGDNFKFVATEEIPSDRIKLGYDDMNCLYDFVVRSYENEQEAYSLGLKSDVVIIGSAPTKYIEERIKNKKLTFRYSERIHKDGFKIKNYLSLIKHYTLKENKNVYLLCSSAYSTYDFNISFAYIGKCYKWGYFPEVKKYNLKELFKKKNNKVDEILWVGRFLNWKHPEKVIEIARKLKEENYKFNVKMIGIGPMFDEIADLINKYNLSDVVKLLGSINNKEVRVYMEKANIYLFTSDYNEGWGAVLNESMNSVCAVISSHAIGATPFLINNNRNGLVYKDESFDDLYFKVKLLINNRKLQTELGINAYKTMINYWNAEYASKEFLKLCNNLLKNKKSDKNSNINKPCTKAKFILQCRMYDYIVGDRNDKKDY